MTGFSNVDTTVTKQYYRGTDGNDKVRFVKSKEQGEVVGQGPLQHTKAPERYGANLGAGNDTVIINAGAWVGDHGGGINLGHGNDTVTLNAGANLGGSPAGEIITGGGGTDTLNLNGNFKLKEKQPLYSPVRGPKILFEDLTTGRTISVNHFEKISLNGTPLDIDNILGIPDPTVNETPDPTVNETPDPTVNETPDPTVNETPDPTVNETPDPTVNETPDPTVNETPDPTVNETPDPTVNETPDPTVNETPDPTVNETPDPTVNETPDPTVNETPDPIEQLFSTLSNPEASTGDKLLAVLRFVLLNRQNTQSENQETPARVF